MRMRTFLLAAALTLGSAAGAGAAEHRFGLGELYWRSIHDLGGSGLKSNGVAPYLTYQYVPAGIFKLELDLEYYRKGFGGSTSAAYSPVAWVLIEFGLYGGVGIGVTFSDSLSSNVSDPFYAARLGYDFQLVPRLHFDVNANYRANTFKDLRRGVKSYDTDSITFGAAARVAF
ncbi:MAG TPA: hypothetical protein VGV61_01925 [Thermoanaerobaculia bacterium]|jgi:hypothetical protein|nr:hypothetical protein [Thermoanaerobaculia bacterium]